MGTNSDLNGSVEGSVGTYVNTDLKTNVTAGAGAISSFGVSSALLPT